MQGSLKLFCFTVLASTILAWGLRYPLFEYANRFSDLTDATSKIRHISDGGEELMKGLPLFPYPAPAVLVYCALILPFQHPVVAYLVFCLFASLTGAGLILKGLGSARNFQNITAIAITFGCSYPIMFCVDRGNIEIVSVLLCAYGLALFVHKSYYPSSIMFALAVAIKPFPVLFFYLFLKRKLYKQIGAAAITFLAVNLLALYWIGPSIPVAYHALKQGSALFFKEYVLQYHYSEIGFDHSLFSCVKQVLRISMREIPKWQAIGPAFWVYSGISALIIGFTAFYFWHKPALNQLFAVVSLILLLPPVSIDYTLMALLLVWGALLIHMAQEEVPNAILFLMPLALLMTPQSYLRIGNTGFGGQAKAILLLILLGVAAKIDLPSRLFGEITAPVTQQKRRRFPV